MSEITIRQATPEDAKELLHPQFVNIYDGIDYLPEYFAEFLAFSNTTSYVAIKNNEIIGFTSMYVVDDGETVIVRASRVCPKFSGQGVYKYLLSYALEHTSARAVAFTTDSLNEYNCKPSFRKEYTLLDTQSISVFLIDTDIRVKPDDLSKLHVPNDEEWLMYFTSDVIKPYLFPKDRIIVDWIPFRLLKSNISLMKSHRTQFLSNVSVCKDGTISGLLSISTTVRVQYPPYVSHLFIYGRDTCTNTLYEHVIGHVMGAQKMTKGGSVIKLFVYTGQDCYQDLLDDVMVNIGLTKSDWKNDHNQIYTHMLLFEKMLK